MADDAVRAIPRILPLDWDPQRRPEGGGRPPRLTEGVAQALYKGLVFGLPHPIAASQAHIHPDTFQTWLRRGRIEQADPTSAYGCFYLAMQQAKRECEAELIGRIRVAGIRHWTANAWLLERKWPERWGRHFRVEADRGGITVGQVAPLGEQVRALRKERGQFLSVVERAMALLTDQRADVTAEGELTQETVTG